MTLQDLGNIGEFVGAIGVVASLIYLALQVRQTSRQINQNTNSVLGSVELENARLASDWPWWANREVPLARSFTEYVDSRVSTSSKHEASHGVAPIWPGPGARQEHEGDVE